MLHVPAPQSSPVVHSFAGLFEHRWQSPSPVHTRLRSFVQVWAQVAAVVQLDPVFEHFPQPVSVVH